MQDSLMIDIQNMLLAMALSTPRVLACLAILPGFGTNTLTGLGRNAISFAIALPATIPTFAFLEEMRPSTLVIGMLAFKEVGVGLILGVMLAIPIWVAQSIGSILDTMRSPIQLMDTIASQDRDASALGAVLLQALVVVMIQAGLFVAMTRIIIESFALWPAFTITPPFEAGQFDVLLKRFADFIWYIVVYGAPVIIPLLLIDFAFAIVGVFASNLQVSFISSPLKMLTGLFIVLVYWPTFSHHIAGDFSRMLEFLPGLLAGQGR